MRKPENGNFEVILFKHKNKSFSISMWDDEPAYTCDGGKNFVNFNINNSDVITSCLSVPHSQTKGTTCKLIL